MRKKNFFFFLTIEKSLDNEKNKITVKKEDVQTSIVHSQFKDRNKPGEVLVKFNETVKFKQSTSKINLKLTQGLDKQFRYMNNKLSKKSEGKKIFFFFYFCSF